MLYQRWGEDNIRCAEIPKPPQLQLEATAGRQCHHSQNQHRRRRLRRWKVRYAQVLPRQPTAAAAEWLVVMIATWIREYLEQSHAVDS